VIDIVFRDFLETQLEEGMGLAAASDVLDLIPLGGMPPRRYVVCFHCKGFAESEDGAIVEANEFAVGIWFREDHLRAVDAGMLVTWLTPRIHHPNVLPPYVCLGRTPVGVGLIEVVYQLHEVITYNKMSLRDPLNPDAATWARANLHLFPADDRPLKRRAEVASATAAAESDFTIEEIVP
jgi:hypothetical protein